MDKQDSYGITILNDDNYEAEIKAHEYLFVLFYSSTKSDAGGLLHDYYVAAGRLADKLGHDEPNAKADVQRHYLAKIDMAENKRIAKSLGIKDNTDVLRWYHNGKSTGNHKAHPITSDLIIRHVLRKTGQADHHTDIVKCEDLVLFDTVHR